MGKYCNALKWLKKVNPVQKTMIYLLFKVYIITISKTQAEMNKSYYAKNDNNLIKTPLVYELFDADTAWNWC